MTVGLEHFLILSAVLFAIGLYGALAKRNAVAILMGIEIMFNAVNVALVAFSRFSAAQVITGQVFAIFVIPVAAGEAAVALALIIAIYRTRQTVDLGRVDLMRW